MRVMRSIGAYGAALLALSACTLFTPFGTDLTGGAPVADDGGTDASSPPSDATVDAEAATCSRGDRVVPLRVFDASPTPGYVCALDNVLVEDGQVAGIDRGPDEAPLADTSVTGCIGVELAAPVDQVTVRARPTAQGCLTACSGNCGSGHDFHVFLATRPDQWAHVGAVDLVGSELTDYAIEVPTPEVRFVAICRSGWGDSRDDIAVDAIHGRCR